MKVVLRTVILVLSVVFMISCSLFEEPYSFKVSSTGELSVENSWSIRGSISIPSTIDGITVKRIGMGAFLGCSKMTSVSIPDSVTEIGSLAFKGCSGLTSVSLPESVKKVEWWAFNDCTNLESFYIPASVTSLDTGPFINCPKLKDIVVSNKNPVYKAENGALYKSNQLIACPSANGYYTIPNGVSFIATMAFDGCKELVGVYIPDSVTVIQSNVFFGCTKLKTVVFPSSLSSISNGMFQGCSSLESLVLPETVKTIYGFAFCECSKLVGISIPSGVTMIGDSAFKDCKSLVRISFGGTVNQWHAISKGTSWNSGVPSSCIVICSDGIVDIFQ